MHMLVREEEQVHLLLSAAPSTFLLLKNRASSSESPVGMARGRRGPWESSHSVIGRDAWGTKGKTIRVRVY